MSAQRSGDLLHRLDAGSHGLLAPEIQEHAGPGGRVVFPELLKFFFEEIGTDGLEIIAEQISQRNFCCEVRFSLRLSTHQRVFFSSGG